MLQGHARHLYVEKIASGPFGAGIQLAGHACAWVCLDEGPVFRRVLPASSATEATGKDD